MKMMMKLVGLTMVLGLVLLTGVAFAADTNTLTVTATVVGTCKFVSGSSSLNFGNLDPSVGTNASASTTVNFWCTKGVTTDSIAADNGAHWSGSSRQMAEAGGDLIPYSLNLTKDANTNQGPASPRTLTIDGTVLGTDYTSKTAGSYSDTVTLSINP
jgi:spore coat protein U-like protein